ncbi:MAG: LPS export ABC transporter permease LptG [Nitrospirae bacterium]|nr:LPS export ABC transporter permease LptG [Nitrospirota bacterium]
MKLLDRYIFMAFIRTSFMVLAGIVVLFLCMTFLREADDFIKYKATMAQIAKYYLYSIPSMAGQALPFAALIGTLLSLGNLSRHQEITAMRAGGLGLINIIVPVLFGGILISGLGFLNNEVIMPAYTARAAFIRNVEVEKKQQRVIFQQRRLWLRGPDNSIANIDLVTPDRKEMIGVNIYKLNPDFSVRERIKAGRLVWEDTAWKLRESQKFVTRDDAIISQKSDGEVYNIVDRPEDMGMIVKSSEEMNFTELWDYVRRLKGSGYKAVRYEVDLHGKVAYPFASLLMVMIATPFSLQRVRSGGAARGIALSLLIATVYWALTSSGRALGLSGAIPPLQAAWLANTVFVVMAIAAIIRMQRQV